MHQRRAQQKRFLRLFAAYAGLYVSLTKTGDSTFLPLVAERSGERNQFRAGVAPAEVQCIFAVHFFANHRQMSRPES